MTDSRARMGTQDSAGVAGGVEVQGVANEALSKRVPETHNAQFWTRAIRRRTADEEIRDRPHEQRPWMRYFGRLP